MIKKTLTDNDNNQQKNYNSSSSYKSSPHEDKNSLTIQEKKTPFHLPDFVSLEKDIKDLISHAPADIGLVLYDTQWEKTIIINAHDSFESASMVKVPVMVEVFLQQQEGKVRLDQSVTLREDHKVGGSGILRNKPSFTEYTVEELINLMITQSDNTATDMLIELVGMESVEIRMSSMGLKNTTLKRKIYDFNAIDEGKDNHTTPMDMYILFKWIYGGSENNPENPSTEESGEYQKTEKNKGEGLMEGNENRLTEENREKIINILKQQKNKDMIPSLLPKDLPIAHKTGGLLGILHDGGIIFPSARKPYILIIMGKNVSNESATKEKYAQISKIIYDKLVLNQ